MALYAFNGTWNEEKTDDVATPEDETIRNTNVVRFKSVYAGPVGYYCNGVGTRIGVVGKLFGGAFGVGGKGRLDEAMDALDNRMAAGDRDIDIVGFSRGAALALAFANRVTKRIKVNDKPIKIRFVGLFDVVGSFGFALNVGFLRFQEYNLGYELTLPPNVEYCFHAMAVDEPRQTFRNTRVKGAYEVWFRGAHSDIGGGNTNLGLNNIAFCWLLQKARGCGLPIPENHVLEARKGCVPTASVKFSSFDPVRDAFRAVDKGDLVHHTVAIPCGNRDYFDPPADCRRETAELEAVVERSTLFT